MCLYSPGSMDPRILSAAANRVVSMVILSLGLSIVIIDVFAMISHRTTSTGNFRLPYRLGNQRQRLERRLSWELAE